MASLKADVSALVAVLVGEHECTVRVTRAGHWRISRPGYSSVTMFRTPSDQRAISNMRADVKRHLGINL